MEDTMRDEYTPADLKNAVRGKHYEEYQRYLRAKAEATDELRPEYKLSELENRVRGKYADRLLRPFAKIDPDTHTALPADEAVNTVLHGLIQSTDDPTAGGGDESDY